MEEIFHFFHIFLFSSNLHITLYKSENDRNVHIQKLLISFSNFSNYFKAQNNHLFSLLLILNLLTVYYYVK